MFTAVIVDDEQMICTLIERLVDWEACGVQIIGIAHDGQPALDMERRDSPRWIWSGGTARASSSPTSASRCSTGWR